MAKSNYTDTYNVFSFTDPSNQQIMLPHSVLSFRHFFMTQYLIKYRKNFKFYLFWWYKGALLVRLRHHALVGPIYYIDDLPCLIIYSSVQFKAWSLKSYTLLSK
jgi:hypothetical protein